MCLRRSKAVIHPSGQVYDGFKRETKTVYCAQDTHEFTRNVQCQTTIAFSRTEVSGRTCSRRTEQPGNQARPHKRPYGIAPEATEDGWEGEAYCESDRDWVSC